MTERALLINRIIAPVTALGPGVRVGVWVQGCTIGCAGCASTDTWSSDGGTLMSVESAAEQVVGVAGQTGATGLTISGGEPFQQAEAVAELVELSRSRWPGSDPMDALVFTGYTARAARRRSARLWRVADLIVAGPYRRDRPARHPLLASSNQSIEQRTDLGAQRLATMVSSRRIQVAAQGRDLVIVGLPDPGDLDRLREALERRGVHLGSVSWQEQQT